MGSLKDFIIKEELNDNLFWKIDTYFQGKNDELKAFNGLIDTCRLNRSYNPKTIEAYIVGNSDLNSNLKKCVDFLNDNVQGTSDSAIDYNNIMYNVVKTIIGNKTEGIKYTNINNNENNN